MRLNRGTLALIIVSVAVIVGVMLFTSSDVNAPASEPTATSPAITGPLFPDLEAAALSSLEIRNNETGDLVRLTRDGETWTIDEASFPQELDTDTEKAAGHVETFVSLQSVDQFAGEEGRLNVFGLTEPNFTVTASGEADGETITYTLDIGDRSQTAQRFYALVNGDQTTVYQILFTQSNELTDLVELPPYVPTPTPPPTLTPTPNPFSEVEQTETAAALEPTLTAEYLTFIAPPPTATATPEAEESGDSDTDSSATPEGETEASPTPDPTN